MLENREQVQALVEQATVVDFKTVGERWNRLAEELDAGRLWCGDHSPRFFDLLCAVARLSDKTSTQTTKIATCYGGDINQRSDRS